MTRRALLAVLALLAAGPRPAGAQEADDGELDRFMERVLEQRARNAAARLQYVLDERSRFRVTGPGGAALWGFRGDYTWYERDGFFVRSPVRIDGVTIGEARRREYEAEWLQREQRRSRRRRDERRPPERTSRRSTRDNVELAVERLWGARPEDGLLDAIAEQAETWGDDHAAIVAAADRILDALGGVPAVGFGRAVERARDGFAMLETGRLLPDEVAGPLGRSIARIAPAAPAATDAEFERFLELFDLAVRFDLALPPVDAAPAATHADPAVAAVRAAALAARRRALPAPAGGADNGRRRREPGPADPAWGGIEPRFVADAYFLDFEFEPGNYYLVGRERLDGRDVLRIEYYPERMFTEGRGGADGDPDRTGGRGATDGDADRTGDRGDTNGDADRTGDRGDTNGDADRTGGRGAADEEPERTGDRDGRAGRGKETDGEGGGREAAGMDKTSLVTLWIDPAQHQIVRYTFDNLGFDFLPGRWLFRLDDLTASMTMRQPFPGVWLPARIEVRAALSLAAGAYEFVGTRTYANYREAETGGRLRAVGPGLPR